MVKGEGVRVNEEEVPSIGGKLMAYRQSLSEDHTFLKVLGMCVCTCMQV